MRLRVGARTDIGRVRDLNEDVYALRAEQGLFLVCDGMGGCPSGEVASQMAAEAILERLKVEHNGAASGPLSGAFREFRSRCGRRIAVLGAHGAPARKRSGVTGLPRATEPGCGAEPHVSSAGERGYLLRTSLLADAVRRSNQFIYDRAQHDSRHAEMGTTVVSAWIAGHIASVAHVGDSRAYLWHSGRLEALTRDHSLVTHQNVLLRVLGREPHVEVDLTEVPVRPGDYLVLCSDGLTRMVSEPMLAYAIGHLRHPQRICDYLVDAANQNGGADNITIVVVEVMDSWTAIRRLRRILFPW